MELGGAHADQGKGGNRDGLPWEKARVLLFKIHTSLPLEFNTCVHFLNICIKYIHVAINNTNMSFKRPENVFLLLFQDSYTWQYLLAL